MRMSLFTYNGNSINDITNYQAWYEKGQVLVPESSPNYIQRYSTFPALSGGVLNQVLFTIKIQCKGTIHSQRQTIKQWFDTSVQTPGTLIAKDTADADRQWFLKAIPIRVFEEETGVMVITLALHEPYWRVVTDSTDSWAITATGQTNVVTVLGNAPARPVLTITPTSTRTGTYLYRRWIFCRNPNNRAMPYEPFDCTFGGLDTATLVTAGKMLSSGNDLRIFVDDEEQQRWLKGMNTATTLVWITLSFSFPIKPTLAGSHTAGATTFTFQENPTNLNYLKRLAKVHSKILYVGTEAITFTAVNLVDYTVTGCTRGTRGTTAATHADGDICYWVEHDVWLVYGDSAAAAPFLEDTFKPMFDVTQSTNTLRAYADYWDDSPEPAQSNSSRPGEWLPQVIRSVGGESRYYTDTHAADVNPAAEMGMRLMSYMLGNAWKPETGVIAWKLYHPGGITTVEVPVSPANSGEKYRVGGAWPALVGLQKSNDGIKWITQWTEASPGTASTWTSITNTGSISLGGTYKYIRFIVAGTIGSAANSEAALEVDNLKITLNSSNVVQGTLRPEEQHYQTRGKITNTTTGEWIRFTHPGLLNKAYTLDCDLKTLKYFDGTNIPIVLSSLRTDWLNLVPGSNTLRWNDVGTGNVTISLAWEDRANL